MWTLPPFSLSQFLCSKNITESGWMVSWISFVPSSLFLSHAGISGNSPQTGPPLPIFSFKTRLGFPSNPLEQHFYIEGCGFATFWWSSYHNCWSPILWFELFNMVLLDLDQEYEWPILIDVNGVLRSWKALSWEVVILALRKGLSFLQKLNIIIFFLLWCSKYHDIVYFFCLFWQRYFHPCYYVNWVWFRPSPTPVGPDPAGRAIVGPL